METNMSKTCEFGEASNLFHNLKMSLAKQNTTNNYLQLAGPEGYAHFLKFQTQVSFKLFDLVESCPNIINQSNHMRMSEIIKLGLDLKLNRN